MPGTAQQQHPGDARKRRQAQSRPSATPATESTTTTKSDFGARVTVDTNDDEAIEGWLYADTAQGLLVALDPIGRDVRFIPATRAGTVSYRYMEPRAAFAQRSAVWDDAVQALNVEAGRALHYVDFQYVRRLDGKILRSVEPLKRESTNASIVAVTVELRAVHGDLIDEVDRSGLGAVLMTNAPVIRALVREDRLPAIDTALVQPADLRAMIALARDQDLLGDDLGRQWLQRAAPERLVAQGGRGKPSRVLRWAGAATKLLVGTGFAAGNLVLGAAASVMQTLPTIDGTTLMAGVAVLTSTYTGLNAAAGALKEMAEALEEPSAQKS